MRDWVVDVVRQLGPVGVGLLTLLENVVPPIPSELIMPLAGYLASQDQISFAAAVAAGSLGSLAGAILWYAIGRSMSERRFRDWVDRRGAWIAMTDEDVDRASHWFRRHGGSSVLLGRVVPGVRTFISLPAGFSRMPLMPFIAYTAIGTIVWALALTWAGRFLGERFPIVGEYVGIAAWVVLGAAVLWYGIRVVRLTRGQDDGDRTDAADNVTNPRESGMRGPARE